MVLPTFSTAISYCRKLLRYFLLTERRASLPTLFRSPTAQPSDERRAIWLELDDFLRKETEEAHSFVLWQSPRIYWHATCNGPVWSNENPTRLTSASSAPHWSKVLIERFGQGLRWNFQHRLSCTYCAISVWDQNPQQVNHGTRGVRISERFLRSIVGISELLLR